jgi:hypothetical protein
MIKPHKGWVEGKMYMGDFRIIGTLLNSAYFGLVGASPYPAVAPFRLRFACREFFAAVLLLGTGEKNRRLRLRKSFQATGQPGN